MVFIQEKDEKLGLIARYRAIMDSFRGKQPDFVTAKGFWLDLYTGKTTIMLCAIIETDV